MKLQHILWLFLLYFSAIKCSIVWIIYPNIHVKYSTNMWAHYSLRKLVCLFERIVVDPKVKIMKSLDEAQNIVANPDEEEKGDHPEPLFPTLKLYMELQR